MGYIQEPKGVDLLIGPSVLTEQDKKMISEIIANYKRTGRIPVKNKRANFRGRTRTTVSSKATA